MEEGGIYMIKNIISNKFYIGSTNNFKLRKNAHFSALKSNSHANSYLQNAYNKYGIDNFEFIVLEILSDLSRKNLCIVEQEYFNTKERSRMYNLTFIADGGGGETTKIPVYILNLKSEIVAEYDSVTNAVIGLGYSKYLTLNTLRIIKGSYRIVSVEFYNKYKYIIEQWKNSKKISLGIKEKPSKIKLSDVLEANPLSFTFCLNNEDVTFNNALELAEYLKLDDKRTSNLTYLQEEYAKKVLKIIYL